jgi:hypothetical protein
VVAAAAAAAEYPLNLVTQASVKNGETTVTSSVLIRVDRLMEETRRTRVSDALRYGGYPDFLQALRSLPSIGSVELARRKVEIRYAHETRDESQRRLVIVGDRPLFFLSGDPATPRGGFELTVIELVFDAQGRATGRMSGAARVRPGPDGAVVLDDFADTLVQLTQQ